MAVTTNDIAATLELIRRLAICGSDADALSRLADIASKSTQPVIVSWLNAHGLVLAARDRVFRNNLLKSSLIFRDGVGMSVLMKLMGKNAGANMNGTDFIPRILAAHAGKPVALIGTKEPYLSRAADAFRGRGINVAAASDGFHTLDAYATVAANSAADFIVLAMGMPRQEEVAGFLQDKLKHPCVILNGGAILDFIAGRFPRAPMLVRRLRMEWLFRLLQEPRRLWRRYILGGFLFAFYGLRIALADRRT